MDFIPDKNTSLYLHSQNKNTKTLCIKFNMRLYSECDLLEQPIQKTNRKILYHELMKDKYNTAQYQNQEFWILLDIILTTYSSVVSNR